MKSYYDGSNFSCICFVFFSFSFWTWQFKKENKTQKSSIQYIKINFKKLLGILTTLPLLRRHV